MDTPKPNLETDSTPGSAETEEDRRRRRLELARRIFKELHAQCFWSYRPDAVIQQEDIPWLIRELRYYGGHRGYKAAEDLCR